MYRHIRRVRMSMSTGHNQQLRRLLTHQLLLRSIDQVCFWKHSQLCTPQPETDATARRATVATSVNCCSISVSLLPTRATTMVCVSHSAMETTSVPTATLATLAKHVMSLLICVKRLIHARMALLACPKLMTTFACVRLASSVRTAPSKLRSSALRTNVSTTLCAYRWDYLSQELIVMVIHVNVAMITKECTARSRMICAGMSSVSTAIVRRASAFVIQECPFVKWIRSARTILARMVERALMWLMAWALKPIACVQLAPLVGTVNSRIIARIWARLFVARETSVCCSMETISVSAHRHKLAMGVVKVNYIPYFSISVLFDVDLIYYKNV